MILLGEHTTGRDNNTPLLRLLAATCVIAFHSFYFTGHLGDDPLTRWTGDTNLSLVGVKCFFVLSGFLVTQSWLRRAQLCAFVAARVLRIYPALFAAVALSIVLAGASSSVPWRAFIADPATIAYAWQNALGWRMTFYLPGAFPTNLFAGGVNGSLWTLPIELRLYVGIALAGVAGVLARRQLCAAVFVLLVALIAAKPEWLPLAPNNENVRAFALLFALGALAQVWRDAIPLSLTVVVASCILFLWNPGGLVRGAALAVPFAYGVLVLAYHPRLQWPLLARVGDYSYGLYVYAFPIQQTIVAHVPGIAPLGLLVSGFAATFAVAALSWHLMEKPAIGLKSRFH